MLQRTMFTLWLLILNFNTLLASELPKPYVTCTLSGQLGNQMFEIACTLAYAWDHQAQALFPDLNRTDYNIPINRKKIFFRLDASPLPRPVQNVFGQYVPFTKVEIPYIPDQNLS